MSVIITSFKKSRKVILMLKQQINVHFAGVLGLNHYQIVHFIRMEGIWSSKKRTMEEIRNALLIIIKKIPFWFMILANLVYLSPWKFLLHVLEISLLMISEKIGKTQSRQNIREVGRCNGTYSFSSKTPTDDSSWRKLLMHKKEIDEVPEVQAQK